jgi:hypothetical protein
MITVGTPGLGVRQPDGVLSRFRPDGIFVRMEFSSGWKIVRMGNRPDGKSVAWKSSGWEIRQRGPMRVADAQTGRPYSNHYPIRERGNGFQSNSLSHPGTGKWRSIEFIIPSGNGEMAFNRIQIRNLN